MTTAKTTTLRKDEILDVATQLFAERGYDGVSIHDVAERVGMGKASLFYHFASKDTLYEAVMERVVDGLQGALGRIYASEGSFAERLDLVTATLTQALGTQPFAARLLLRETMDWGPAMAARLVDRIAVVLDAGAAWIRAGQEEGVFVDGDPRHLILSVIGMHLVPFAMERFVERYVGTTPFGPAFIEARTRELRTQTRNLQLRH